MLHQRPPLCPVCCGLLGPDRVQLLETPGKTQKGLEHDPFSRDRNCSAPARQLQRGTFLFPSFLHASFLTRGSEESLKKLECTKWGSVRAQARGRLLLSYSAQGPVTPPDVSYDSKNIQDQSAKRFFGLLCNRKL